MCFRVAFIFCLSTIPLATLSPAAETAQAKRDANGFLVRTIQSQYQLGVTRIRVLLPDKPSKNRIEFCMCCQWKQEPLRSGATDY